MAQLEEQEVAKNKFKDCYFIFHQKAYENDTPIVCRIHDAFGGINGDQHNCLGCNFADSIDLILSYLNSYPNLKNIQKDFTIYILLLYLLVERIETVLEILQVPHNYKEKHFKVFEQVRKWANFIKHPKSFVLTHHPTYDFENSNLYTSSEFHITINEQFVDKFYKGLRNIDEQKRINKELYQKLKNQTAVHVVFPDIYKLTEKLCYSVNKFVNVITNNEVYIDILNDETTIDRYFEDQ